MITGWKDGRAKKKTKKKNRLAAREEKSLLPASQASQQFFTFLVGFFFFWPRHRSQRPFARRNAFQCFCVFHFPPYLLRACFPPSSARLPFFLLSAGEKRIFCECRDFFYLVENEKGSGSDLTCCSPHGLVAANNNAWKKIWSMLFFSNERNCKADDVRSQSHKTGCNMLSWNTIWLYTGRCRHFSLFSAIPKIKSFFEKLGKF